MLSSIERCFLGALLFSTLTLAGQTQGNAGEADPQTAVAPRVDTIHPASTGEKPDGLQPGEDPENRLILPFVKHLGSDQKEFWTAPARLRVKDLKWIAPLAGVTAAFIASDSWWAKQVPMSHVQTSLHISDYGVYSLIGLSGASFLLGHVRRDSHLEEAGLLTWKLRSIALPWLIY
jgi:hypothetical protein